MILQLLRWLEVTHCEVNTHRSERRTTTSCRSDRSQTHRSLNADSFWILQPTFTSHINYTSFRFMKQGSNLFSDTVTVKNATRATANASATFTQEGVPGCSLQIGATVNIHTWFDCLNQWIWVGLNIFLLDGSCDHQVLTCSWRTMQGTKQATL